MLFISSTILHAQFHLSHFPSRKIIFYTGFFISVIALYLKKKDCCNCPTAKKETKLEHKLLHLLTRLGRVCIKATHGYPKLHAHPNYDLLCPHLHNAGLFARQTKYTDLLVFTSKLHPMSKYDSLIALLKVKLVSLPLLELLAQLQI